MRKLHDQPACRGNGPALPSDVGGHHGRLAARSSQLGRSLPPTPDILRRRSEPTRWAMSGSPCSSAHSSGFQKLTKLHNASNGQHQARIRSRRYREAQLRCVTAASGT